MPSQTSRFTRLSASAGAADTSGLVVNAALAAALAVATTMGLCMAVALVGWFFADSGAHGNTLDALRAGGVAWVLGLGGSADTSIGHIGLTPLGLTAIEVLAVARYVRWGWRRSQVTEVLAPRALGIAWTAFVVVFVLLAVIILGVIAPASVSPSMSGTFLGALLIGGLTSGWIGGLESGHVGELWLRLPANARVAIRVSAQALLMLVAAAAVLVAISLAISLGHARDTYNALGLGFGDALMLTVVCALSLPNAVGFAIAYLAGPGFAVGTNTTVTVTSVKLGALPLFPTVAALPDPGSQPGWYVVLLFVPGMCALIVAGRIQREFADDETDGWSQVLVRGLGGGALAGFIGTVFATISGGALGDHRMAEIGAGFWPVLVGLVGGMALGGVLGSAIVAGWQRWRH